MGWLFLAVNKLCRRVSFSQAGAHGVAVAVGLEGQMTAGVDRAQGILDTSGRLEVQVHPSDEIDHNVPRWSKCVHWSIDI